MTQPEQLELPLVIPPAPPKRIKFYVGSDKDSNWDHAHKIGLTGDAAKEFSYTCLEVELTLELNEDGSSKIVEVEGRKVAD